MTPAEDRPTFTFNKHPLSQEPPSETVAQPTPTFGESSFVPNTSTVDLIAGRYRLHEKIGEGGMAVNCRNPLRFGISLELYSQALTRLTGIRDKFPR